VFAGKVSVTYLDAAGVPQPCPIAWIDNFAMRNFTNDAVFDDTLPVADGILEVGNRVPLDRLRSAMEDLFRRKRYIKAGQSVAVEVQRT
jgi:hypothetical protein